MKTSLANFLFLFFFCQRHIYVNDRNSGKLSKAICLKSTLKTAVSLIYLISDTTEVELIISVQNIFFFSLKNGYKVGLLVRIEETDIET